MRCSTTRYETIEESDLVILLISDSAMASNHEKVFSKLKKVPYRKWSYLYLCLCIYHKDSGKVSTVKDSFVKLVYPNPTDVVPSPVSMSASHLSVLGDRVQWIEPMVSLRF